MLQALCFKSGNPVILKGGSEAFYSNQIFQNYLENLLKKNKVR
jgi:glutamate-5-semialdehyde dehydrogenase